MIGQLCIAGIFLSVGIFMIFINVWSMSYEKRFLSGDVSFTKGKITEICEHGGMAGESEGVWYTASVEYQVNGELYRISGTDKCLKKYIYVNKNSYQAGDIVDIAYRNDKTNDCIIKGNNHGKNGKFIILFGVVFIIIALLYMISLFLN